LPSRFAGLGVAFGQFHSCGSSLSWVFLQSGAVDSGQGVRTQSP
jgi:hypothetical protein